jgi:hypothetical protein
MLRCTNAPCATFKALLARSIGANARALQADVARMLQLQVAWQIIHATGLDFRPPESDHMNKTNSV